MSLVALIKLAFLHSKSRVPKTLRAAFWRRMVYLQFETKNKKLRLNKSKCYPFELENIVKTAFASMESIFERDFLKVYTAFEKSTRGKWKMDLFSNRLHFKFKNRLSRITIPSIWKLLEGIVFSNGPGYSRIYLSYLGCKVDCFACLLVMIKTNTTRKPTT